LVNMSRSELELFSPDEFEWRSETLTVADSPRYWKIAVAGFDAVPAMMNHLEDDRLIVSSFERGRGLFEHLPTLRISDVMTHLIKRLSAGEIMRTWGEGSEPLRIRRKTVEEWLTAVQAKGERQYLVSHALRLPASPPRDKNEHDVS